MKKAYSGHCIVQNCQYTLYLDYIETARGSVPGLIDCLYLGLHNPPECQNCEMYKSALRDKNTIK